MEHLGYVYYKYTSRSEPNNIYYKCSSEHTLQCYGTAKSDDNGVLTVTTEHNHPTAAEILNGVNPSKQIDDLHAFKAMLKKRAIDEVGSLTRIYKSTAVRYPDSSVVYHLRAARDYMSKMRKASLPKEPSTFSAFHKLFIKNRLKRYESDGEHFFTGCIVDSQGKASIIFSSPKFVRSVLSLNPSEMYVDTMCKTFPLKPKAKLLLIIHCLVMNYNFPMLYCLMEDDTAEAFDKVFKYIKNSLMPSYQPHSIYVQHDPRLTVPLRSYFSPEIMTGCWFFHNQAIWDEMVDLRLLDLIGRNNRARMCLKMLMTLPILRKECIPTGFATIKNYAKRYFVDMDSLFNYYENYWLNTIGAQDISINGTPERAMCNLEFFHHNLLIKFRRHPTIWKFMDTACSLTNMFATVVKRIKKSEYPRGNFLCYSIYVSRPLKTDMERIEKDIVTLEMFLATTCDSSELYVRSLSDWTIRTANDGNNDELDDASSVYSDDDSHDPVNAIIIHHNLRRITSSEDLDQDYAVNNYLFSRLRLDEPPRDNVPSRDHSSAIDNAVALDYYRSRENSVSEDNLIGGVNGNEHRENLIADELADAMQDDNSGYENPLYEHSGARLFSNQYDAETPIRQLKTPSTAVEGNHVLEEPLRGFCMTCHTRKDEYKFIAVPCGHSWICDGCAERKMKNCPYCRRVVEKYVRIWETGY